MAGIFEHSALKRNTFKGPFYSTILETVRLFVRAVARAKLVTALRVSQHTHYFHIKLDTFQIEMDVFQIRLHTLQLNTNKNPIKNTIFRLFKKISIAYM